MVILNELNIVLRYDYLPLIKHPYKAGIKAQRGVEF
jgi:ATP:corrinoid adenosyltransferase